MGVKLIQMKGGCGQMKGGCGKGGCGQAAYLQSWIGVLKGDSRLLIHAAAADQRAADYIRGEKVPSEPEPIISEATNNH